MLLLNANKLFDFGGLRSKTQILTIIGANGEIMPQAVIFMRARAVSVPPMLICIAIEGAYRAFLDLKTPFAVIAGAAAINVVLNVLFLFGAYTTSIR